MLKKSCKRNERNKVLLKDWAECFLDIVMVYPDHGDILRYQPNSKSLSQKIETILYNAALAITGTIKDTSQMKLYNELDLLSLDFCSENCVCFSRLKKNWLTGISIQYDTTKQSLIQHSVNWECYVLF